MTGKHQHYMYIIRLQPKRIVEFISRNKYDTCAQTVENLKSIGYFIRVAGSKILHVRVGLPSDKSSK